MTMNEILEKDVPNHSCQEVTYIEESHTKGGITFRVVRYDDESERYFLNVPLENKWFELDTKEDSPTIMDEDLEEPEDQPNPMAEIFDPITDKIADIKDTMTGQQFVDLMVAIKGLQAKLDRDKTYGVELGPLNKGDKVKIIQNPRPNCHEVGLHWPNGWERILGKTGKVVKVFTAKTMSYDKTIPWAYTIEVPGEDRDFGPCPRDWFVKV